MAYCRTFAEDQFVGFEGRESVVKITPKETSETDVLETVGKDTQWTSGNTHNLKRCVELFQ